jgi:hypothetical protein
LTITAGDQGKTYGQDLALGTSAFTTVGLLNSDTVTGASLTSAGAAANAAVAGSPYAIVPSAATGTGLGNYVITYTNGALTVTPATLTVGLTGTAGKTYDGNNAANSLTSANYAVSGVLFGDDVTANAPAGGTYNTSNAGTGLTITVSGLVLSGGAAGNYILAANTASGKIGTITPETLGIAANSTSRNAGQANPALTFNVTSGTLFNGDALTGSLDTTATTGSAAGSYPITIGTLSAPANYQIAFTGGTLTVLPGVTTQTAVETAQPAISALTTLANTATSPDALSSSFSGSAPAEVGTVAAPGQRKVQTPQDIALASIASFRAAACSASSATPALFVVLPSATGKKIGGVVVNDGSGEEVLDQAFAAAATSGGELSACRVSKSEIDTTFKKAVSARPMLPHHFTLQLIGNGDRLDPESQHLYRELMADIAQRRTYQIEVIGYAPASEKQAALSRAAAIRALLTKDLIKADKISLTARVKLDALMPSGDQSPIAIPPQRAVEIWVR